MGYAQTYRRWRWSVKWAGVTAGIFLLTWPCRAQSLPAGQPQETWAAQYLDKYPGLAAEWGRLVGKLEHSVQFPAARGQSRLLPLLPEATMSYVAISNYGDLAHEILKVFRQELQESAVLRDWWGQGELAAAGPKIEEYLEKFSQLHQYLGEEIVVSAALEGREPRPLLVAEIRKPGLKKFLQQIVNPSSSNAKGEVRLLDPQELATAEDEKLPQRPVVLVRPDFVVAGLDLATVRNFNARLDRGTREFAATPFGRRVGRAYEGGVTVLAAADLKKILEQASPDSKQSVAFQRSGFADMKYVVWGHKSVDGEATSEMEVSFNSPRHGAAAWLAGAGPLTSLDFVSPKAIFAGTVVLASPAQVLEDLKDLDRASNSSSFAALSQFEQALNLSVKDDVLRYLGGEVTLELDDITPQPVWKLILKVNDAARLQQTLGTLLGAVHFAAQHREDGGVTYYSVRIPAGQTGLEIGYAFVDSHLIIASSPQVVANAVRLHTSGGSLGKAQKFQAALPPGHPSGASALFYEDPLAMTALRLRRLAPAMAESFAQASSETTPAVFCLYGEESAIREASRSGPFDVVTVLVVAAIAIPNLVRSRMAANEASAVGNLRTVNVAEITYAATYPERGYAPDLATLGPDARAPTAYSADHANLVNETLGNESCTANTWCAKSGYQFRVSAVCKKRSCTEYVAVATPVNSNTGTRNFCSTSDGVIRFQAGAPLGAAVSVAECKAWTPLR